MCVRTERYNNNYESFRMKLTLSWLALGLLSMADAWNNGTHAWNSTTAWEITTGNEYCGGHWKYNCQGNYQVNCLSNCQGELPSKLSK